MHFLRQIFSSPVLFLLQPPTRRQWFVLFSVQQRCVYEPSSIVIRVVELVLDGLD
jgi:hypothetical protein